MDSTTVRKKILFVSNSQTSERMFKARWMEALSKVHFTVPLFLFLPIVGYCLWLAFAQLSVGIVGAWFVGGLFVWTFVEYILHRFVFHWQPPGEIGARLHFIFHGVHHDFPNDRLRLVMPPSISIPLAAVFYVGFRATLGDPSVFPFFAGFIVGYLFYDISHYAIHHFNINSTIWKYIKDHHMRHHYAENERGYGVSNPLWDYVFDTMFRKK